MGCVKIESSTVQITPKVALPRPRCAGNFTVAKAREAEPWPCTKGEQILVGIQNVSQHR